MRVSICISINTIGANDNNYFVYNNDYYSLLYMYHIFCNKKNVVSSII